jgi:hypothetical protein
MLQSSSEISHYYKLLSNSQINLEKDIQEITIPQVFNSEPVVPTAVYSIRQAENSPRYKV